MILVQKTGGSGGGGHTLQVAAIQSNTGIILEGDGVSAVVCNKVLLNFSGRTASLSFDSDGAAGISAGIVIIIKFQISSNIAQRQIVLSDSCCDGGIGSGQILGILCLSGLLDVTGIGGDSDSGQDAQDGDDDDQ